MKAMIAYRMGLSRISKSKNGGEVYTFRNIFSKGFMGKEGWDGREGLVMCSMPQPSKNAKIYFHTSKYGTVMSSVVPPTQRYVEILTSGT